MDYNKVVETIVGNRNVQPKRTQWIMLVIVLFFGGNSAFAQGGDIEEMITQIGALNSYRAICASGYKIVESGIAAIKTVKAAEYDLHKVYFASLAKVSPQVSNYLSQSGAISTLQHMLSEISRFSPLVAKTPSLSASERQYSIGVLTYFKTEGAKNADMIADILADGETVMTDGERIGRLMPIVRNIADQHRSLESFMDQTGLLIGQRAESQGEIQTLQSFY